MKRSEINSAIRASTAAFERHGWALPPKPEWDVTDFGLGHFSRFGLVLINLANEPEYCEKLMYAQQNQCTPMHYHLKKKEDIICRSGQLVVAFGSNEETIQVQVCGEMRDIAVADPLTLNAGERVTLTPETRHAFWPATDYAILGEVSTANDDLNDNFFDNPEVGRFSSIEEDEPPYQHPTWTDPS